MRLNAALGKSTLESKADGGSEKASAGHSECS
jgi:hypothetical protein